MKSELSIVYITKDGKKFAYKKDAEEHTSKLAPEFIELGVYYNIEDTGEYAFDFDEMASELEISIAKHLNIDCKVEIKER